MARQGYKLQFNRKGEVAIKDVTGFGPQCEEATKKIEKFLGGAKESTRQHTDEFTDDQDNDLYQEA